MTILPADVFTYIAVLWLPVVVGIMSSPFISWLSAMNIRCRSFAVCTHQRSSRLWFAALRVAFTDVVISGRPQPLILYERKSHMRGLTDHGAAAAAASIAEAYLLLFSASVELRSWAAEQSVTLWQQCALGLLLLLVLPGWIEWHNAVFEANNRVDPEEEEVRVAEKTASKTALCDPGLTLPVLLLALIVIAAINYIPQSMII